MSIEGAFIDAVERIARSRFDAESRPTGTGGQMFNVSDAVKVSRDRDAYTYHLPDRHLAQGSSFGNRNVWVETKGNNDMLRLCSVRAGREVIGGMSITYMIPFVDLSSFGASTASDDGGDQHTLTRAMPSTVGTIHLHHAFQQREFVIGDGLHVLETLFVPNTGSADDPCAVTSVVHLENRSMHPLKLSIVVSCNLRGATARDIDATYESGTVVAWNLSDASSVRVIGSDASPDGHFVSTREDEAYSPGKPLPDRIEGTGDLTGAMQYDVTLLPGSSRKLRFCAAFSPDGVDAARADFKAALNHDLKRTVEYYSDVTGCAELELPDTLLTQGVQWAKACMTRVIFDFPIGIGFTNDPGNSRNIVGRDTAWYAMGCDTVMPEVSCQMLQLLSRYQRSDGLIAEYIDGNTGAVEYHDFNINDNTPLFVMAVAHHLLVTGHRECLKELTRAAELAGECILASIDERGLVVCTATGTGVEGICGWRNVLSNEQINGAVTEVNAECHAALMGLGDICEIDGRPDDAARYRRLGNDLRDAINEHLINQETGLYVRNIDLDGNVFTQATIDMVFPLICGVADLQTTEEVMLRLAEADFMTEGGIRALPSENPRYDPSQQSGCLGGVWPGATWWYALGCANTNPPSVAHSLRSSYWHYVADPKTFNTVPGQFSEWSDGETLVNRGMRLSPWEPPRFMWAAIEGLAGVSFDVKGIRVDPALPADWQWLRLSNLRTRGEVLSFFLIRHDSTYEFYTVHEFDTDGDVEMYQREISSKVEVIVPGVTVSAFEREDELVICVGNGHESLAIAPLLTHDAIPDGGHYRVYRLQSTMQDWEDLGEMSARELQRLTLRIAPHGYALYKFRRI